MNGYLSNPVISLPFYKKMKLEIYTKYLPNETFHENNWPQITKYLSDIIKTKSYKIETKSYNYELKLTQQVFMGIKTSLYDYNPK